jgi:anti-sigma B factor antagonist
VADTNDGEPFAFQIETGDDAIVVRLHGELDAFSALVLGPALAELVLDVSEVRVDGSGLTFLDSTGIATLLDLRTRVSEVGGWFALEGLRAPIREVLEVAGLLEHLQVEDLT